MKIKKQIHSLLLAVGALAGCAAQGNGYIGVSVKEAEKLLEDPSVFLLDVRTEEEFNAGHLANTAWIPVQELQQRILSLPGDKETRIVVYCRSGNRSVTAAKILSGHGYKKIYNLKGGILEWTRQGFPVENRPPTNPS